MSYQFHHPWHWLTYGNNAASLAAIGATLAAVFAYLAYRSTIEQVVVARRTASLEQARYLDETRPHLTVVMDDVLESDPNWKWVYIKNIGRGTAVNIHRDSSLLSICNSLPKDGSFRTQVQINGPGVEEAGTQTVLLHYSSTDGRLFRTQTKIVGTLCVIWEGVQEINEKGLPAPIEVGSRGPDAV